jgi:hypothetical protein
LIEVGWVIFGMVIHDFQYYIKNQSSCCEAKVDKLSPNKEMEAFEIVSSDAAIDPATVMVVPVDTHATFDAVFCSWGNDNFTVIADSVFFDTIDYLLKVNFVVFY